MPDTKSKIVGAAVTCFSRSGYHRTAISQIARKAGVTAPTVFAHYKSKEALFSAALEQYMGRLAQRRPTVIPTNGQTIGASMRELIRYIISETASLDCRLMYWAQLEMPQIGKRVFRARLEAEARRSMEAIAEAQKRGVLSTVCSAELLAAAMVAIGIHHGLIRDYWSSLPAAEVVAEQVSGLLLEGALPR